MTTPQTTPSPKAQERIEQFIEDRWDWADPHSCSALRYSCCGGGKDIDLDALRKALDAFAREVAREQAAQHATQARALRELVEQWRFAANADDDATDLDRGWNEAMRQCAAQAEALLTPSTAQGQTDSGRPHQAKT